jgi:hypothetical protein
LLLGCYFGVRSSTKIKTSQSKAGVICGLITFSGAVNSIMFKPYYAVEGKKVDIFQFAKEL